MPLNRTEALKISRIRCLCGSNSFARIYQGRKPFEFLILRCTQCMACRTLPFPDAKAKDFFMDNKEILNYTLNKSQVRMDRKRLKRDCRIIQTQNIPSPYILDIGCNIGLFASYAKDEGLSVFGIDINAQGVHSAPEVTKRRMCIADANSLPFGEDIFGCVNLSHTLEHLEKPLQALSEIRRVLKSDGLLIINVPNYKGLIPLLRPVSWQGWSPQTHFWHFTPETLVRLLERMDFKVRESKLTAMCPPQINNWFKRVIYRALSGLGERCGMGDNILVVARKVRSPLK